MPSVNPGEVWIVDFGMAAKVRPALLLTGTPAEDELDIVTEAVSTLTGRASTPLDQLARTQRRALER